MIKYFAIVVFLIFCIPLSIYGQEETLPKIKNQVSTNLSYLTLGSLDFSYERTFGKYFAAGIGITNYGKVHQDLNIELSDTYSNYKVNFEINPFVRLYINGSQDRSLFVEISGSYNEGEASGRIVRSDNDLGYGVYGFGTKRNSNTGLGTGVGYRFLLLNNKLVLEAQLGVRRNFDDILYSDISLVRTGIKVGYRF